jgi:hypothetical protein
VETNIDRCEPIKTNSAELIKNQQSEPAFRHYLFIEIVHHTRRLFEEIILEGASTAHCSQATIKRYLEKETCKIRLYRIVEDEATKEKYIEFKPEWNAFRKKDEERRRLNELANNWKEEMKLDLAQSAKVDP